MSLSSYEQRVLAEIEAELSTAQRGRRARLAAGLRWVALCAALAALTATVTLAEVGVLTGRVAAPVAAALGLLGGVAGLAAWRSGYARAR